MIWHLLLLFGMFQEQPDLRKTAEASVFNIQAHLPAYIDDDLMAPEEQKEISKVMHDLDVLNDAIDDKDYIAHVRMLEYDWHALVRYDELLQKSYVL